MALRMISLLLLLYAASGFADEKLDTREICPFESFNASCGLGEVILMTSARYGRMAMGRCIPRDHELGCWTDVIAEANARCSGRRSCSITIPDQRFHEVQVCPKDSGAYFEASFRCARVQTSSSRLCRAQRQLEVDSIPGYILSNSHGADSSFESESGQNRCVWIIRVAEGQKIKLTLYNFGATERRQGASYEGGSSDCHSYGTVREVGGSKVDNLCSEGKHRNRVVYQSKTDAVELTIHGMRPGKGGGDESHPRIFLVRYEAIDCPNPKPPQYGWSERVGDMATVGCNVSGIRWHLVCKESHWTGLEEYRNCSQPPSGSWTLSSLLDDQHRKSGAFPFGLLISIMVGVIIGVILGSAMLAMVLYCRKKRLRKEKARQLDVLRRTPPPEYAFTGLDYLPSSHPCLHQKYVIGRHLSEVPIGPVAPPPSSFTRNASMTSTSDCPDDSNQETLRLPFLCEEHRERQEAVLSAAGGRGGGQHPTRNEQLTTFSTGRTSRASEHHYESPRFDSAGNVGAS